MTTRQIENSIKYDIQPNGRNIGNIVAKIPMRSTRLTTADLRRRLAETKPANLRWRLAEHTADLRRRLAETKPANLRWRLAEHTAKQPPTYAGGSPNTPPTAFDHNSRR
ncbi:MAG: hypothetical protein ACRCUY_06960 [Thermoguttaceae bacterium]